VLNKYDPFQRNLQNLWAPSLMLSSFVGKKFFFTKVVKGSVSDEDSIGNVIWYSMSHSLTLGNGGAWSRSKLENERVIPSFLGVVNPNPF
jgi:hypothetical protein